MKRQHRVVEQNIVIRSKRLRGWLDRTALAVDGLGQPYITDGGLDAIHSWMRAEHAHGYHRGHSAKKRESA